MSQTHQEQLPSLSMPTRGNETAQGNNCTGTCVIKQEREFCKNIRQIETGKFIWWRKQDCSSSSVRLPPNTKQVHLVTHFL